jgi:hypothetical protein
VPNTTLTVANVREYIKTRLGASAVDIELTDSINGDLDTCLRDALRQYNRTKPRYLIKAIPVNSTQKKYRIDNLFPGFLGIIKFEWVESNIVNQQPVDPFIYDNSRLSLHGASIGDYEQQMEYMEYARRIMSVETEWRGQWENIEVTPGVFAEQYFLYLDAPVTPINACVTASCKYTMDETGGASATPAIGTISLTGSAQPTDGEVVTVSDGFQIVVFEFDNDASVLAGHVPVTIGGTALATMLNLISALNHSVLALSTVNGTVTDPKANITNLRPGTGGNVAITTDGVAVGVTGMAGGTNATTGIQDPQIGLGTIPEGDVDWMQDFAVARAKQILTRIRGKFSGIEGPDGSMNEIDFQALAEEGRTDEKDLMDELKRRRRPLAPVIE